MFVHIIYLMFLVMICTLLSILSFKNNMPTFGYLWAACGIVSLCMSLFGIVMISLNKHKK